MAKTKLPTIISVPGVLAYPHLLKADDKFDSDNPKFTLNLVVDKDDKDAAKQAKMINDAHAEARGKKKTESPVRDGDEMEDKDGNAKEEFANKWLFSMKSKYQPKAVDSAKNKLEFIEGGVYPAAGDVVRVAFAINPYEHGKNAGVSLQLRSIQLIEKRSGGGDYADEFGEYEGGFEADQSDAPSKDFDDDPGPGSSDGEGGGHNPDF
jgi:hypothetical protein